MRLTVKDLPSLDGVYDEDLTTFTNRELSTIKRMSGVRAGELMEALAARDNDLLVAIAFVVLVRAGKEPHGTEELLWEAPAGNLELDFSPSDEAEAVGDDARPPESPIESGSANELDELNSHIVRPLRSGGGSSSDGASPATHQSLSGTQG